MQNFQRLKPLKTAVGCGYETALRQTQKTFANIMKGQMLLNIVRVSQKTLTVCTRSLAGNSSLWRFTANALDHNGEREIDEAGTKFTVDR